MSDSTGNQGARPGQSRTERQAKARAGAYRGAQRASDMNVRALPTGAVRAREVGQGSGIVAKQKLSTRMTGNSPYEKQFPQKPDGF